MMMRIIQVGLMLLISTAGTNLPAQQPAGPAARKIGQVLMDFRVDRPVTSVRIPAATQRAVLSKMFRRYLTDENKCNRDFATNSEDYLKAARNAGQIVPSIVDTATGSVTTTGARPCSGVAASRPAPDRVSPARSAADATRSAGTTSRDCWTGRALAANRPRSSAARGEATAASITHFVTGAAVFPP